MTKSGTSIGVRLFIQPIMVMSGLLLIVCYIPMNHYYIDVDCGFLRKGRQSQSIIICRRSNYAVLLSVALIFLIGDFSDRMFLFPLLG